MTKQETLEQMRMVCRMLGHTSVETTQVYLHCIPQFAATITSPLDALHERKIVAFEQPERLMRRNVA